MKEIVAVLRLNKVQPTRDALAEKGFYSMTVQPVLGRGRQKGLEYEIEGLPPVEHHDGPRIHYLPKRMVLIVVSDDQVKDVVDTIMTVNRTGNIGDGKIFVCPVEEAMRVRTKEFGDRALM
jgi:nitrogen regulatory protein PII 2